jgi:hypothetical protein
MRLNNFLKTNKKETVKYNNWIISYDYYENRGYGGNVSNGKDKLTIRGWVATKNDILDTLKKMADSHDEFYKVKDDITGVTLQ